jgi:hypothetical protein
VVVLWVFVALIVVLLAAAAWSDLHWRRQGFRTEIRGRGRNKVKVRVRIDPDAPMPEDPNLLHQDWVRMRDLEDPDGTPPGTQQN